jgi:hypothetical protein
MDDEPNGKDVEGSSHRLDLDTILVVAKRDRGQPQKISIRIGGL